MTVHQLPGFVRVEIWSGTVETSTVTDENGARPLLSDVGKRIIFVDVIEADGGRVSMWDGTDHAQAVREANMLALDFGGKVIDRTGGAA
jgi:hypothetical protein